MYKLALLLLGVLVFFSCEKDTGTPEGGSSEKELYFPPPNNDIWERVSPSELGWSDTKLNELFQFLEENNTRAFVILKDGKIVVEEYWGRDILGINSFNGQSKWYWASAGKTLTSFLIGEAQEDGLLNIMEPSQNYLGEGWSSLSPEQESNISILHHLTMTTGLDYRVDDLDCTDPACLQYRAEPGTQWYYHNAPYTLLSRMVENAADMIIQAYTFQQLGPTIGFNGSWISNRDSYNKVFWSTARMAARFGLLMLNEGDWDGQVIMEDKNYFQSMVTTSQDLNPSYGYLWWLNGKGKVIYPGLPNTFSSDIAPTAPADLFAAMGKNGQFIDVVPSQNLVVIRMGEAPDNSLVPVKFHDDMWAILQEL